MSFGPWLHRELNRRNWSQMDLSRQTGIAQSQISKILTGVRDATPEHCIAFAQALELSREELFQARGWLLIPQNHYAPELDPRAQQLAQEVSQLPLVSRELTLKLIEEVVETTRQLTNKIQELEVNGHESKN